MKEDVHLKRQLGLLHGVGIVAGLIIGTGIYISPQGVTVYAGSAGLSLVLWVVGGVLSMLGALTYAEIGLVIPQSGAVYAYMRVMYGRFAGFLYIWSYLFFVRVGANSIKCLMFGRYVLKPFFPDCAVPEIAITLVATIVSCKLDSMGVVIVTVSDLVCMTRLKQKSLLYAPGSHLNKWVFSSHRNVTCSMSGWLSQRQRLRRSCHRAVSDFSVSPSEVYKKLEESLAKAKVGARQPCRSKTDFVMK